MEASTARGATALPRIREVIERLERDGTAVVGSDATVHRLFPDAISPAEGAALRHWVRSQGGTRSIEIGFGYGFSSLFICEGLLAGREVDVKHVVIDPFQTSRFSDSGHRVVEEAGLAHLVEHYSEESQIVLPRFLGEGRSFDFAFVDGNHRFDSIFLDLIYLGRLVCRGGIVFVDDYQMPAVARAASFCVTNLGWRLEEVSPFDALHQWAVLRTSELLDTRPYDYFVNF